MSSMFPSLEPSKHTFIGVAIGILLVGVLRAALHF